MINEDNKAFLYKYWFPEDVKEIFIVCPKDYPTTCDASMCADNYSYCDNFGDKDLLLLSYGLISKYYQNTKVYYKYAEKFIQENIDSWKKKNILVIGGPSYHHPVSAFLCMKG